MEQKNTNVQKLEIVDSRKEPRYKAVVAIITALCSIATVVATFVGIFCTIPSVIQSSNMQKQTQVVIEPREGDIIVKDGDDYKLLQLISENDIVFPTKIQEVQYTAANSQWVRVDINNTNEEDWSKRDSFVYVINSLSINPHKVHISIIGKISELS
jgi:hypothetical protein